MSRWKRAFLITSAAIAAIPSLGSAQTYKDLLYNAVVPCVVADTRAAGGAIAAGATRAWNVVGSGSFAAQGGSVTGCSVPGFSGTTPQVQAVELNVIAITAAGAGDLAVFAADTATTSVSFLNYTTGWTVANTGAVAVAQASGVGDIKVQAQFAATHVRVTVVGYYMRAPQEVLVHPVPGDAAASGTALLAALAGITDASASKYYVLRLEAGTYDLGTSMLTMKPYVDVAGAGQQATVVKGTGNATGLLAGTISGAANAELRNLQVQASVTSGGDDAIGVVLLATGTTLRDVTIAASNTGSGIAEGIRSASANSAILGSTITSSSNNQAYGITLTGDRDSAPVVKHTAINVTAGGSAIGYGIYIADFAVPAEIRDVEVQVNGGSNAVALYADWANAGTSGNTLNVSTSTFQAAGASTNYAIALTNVGETLNLDQVKAVASSGTSYGLFSGSTGDTYVVDRSELTGGTGSASVGISTFRAGASRLGGAVTAVSATCAASYSGAFAPLSSSCV